MAKSYPVVERTDDTVVVLARSAEEAHAAASDALGPSCTILSIDRVRTGGVGGFFATELVRLVAAPPRGAAVPPAPGAPAPGRMPDDGYTESGLASAEALIASLSEQNSEFAARLRNELLLTPSAAHGGRAPASLITPPPPPPPAPAPATSTPSAPMVAPVRTTAPVAVAERPPAPTTAEQRATLERAAEERRVAEQRAAEQRAAEQRAAEQRLAEQRLAEQRLAEQRAAEERRLAEERAAEQRAAEERRAAEQRLAEQRAAEERRLAEQRAAEQRAAEERRLAEQRAAEQRAAEQRAMLERLAEQRLAEQEAARAAQQDAGAHARVSDGHRTVDQDPAEEWRVEQRMEQHMAEQRIAELSMMGGSAGTAGVGAGATASYRRFSDPGLLGSPPSGAPLDGPRVTTWSGTTLRALGLPDAVVELVVAQEPKDDVEWTVSLMIAVRGLCGSLPQGSTVLVGPAGGELARQLKLVNLSAEELNDSVSSVASPNATPVSLRTAVGDRRVHLVVGGQWHHLATVRPDIVSAAGDNDLFEAIRVAAAWGAKLGWAPVEGRYQRIDPINIAGRIRELLNATSSSDRATFADASLVSS